MGNSTEPSECTEHFMRGGEGSKNFQEGSRHQEGVDFFDDHMVLKHHYLFFKSKPQVRSNIGRPV